MEAQHKKIYVVVGNDVREGLSTLEWTLKNWLSQSISIVILHFSNSFVHTPFGKLPASSVDDENLEVFRMQEMCEYKDFIGKEKIEVLRIEKSEEPIQNIIVGLISRLRVTKLVISMSCMKCSSSREAKSGISGSFYIQKRKPDYCELFIICGGKLVPLKEDNDEGCLDDEEGVVITDIWKKMGEKESSRSWLDKMFPDNAATNVASNPTGASPRQADSPLTSDKQEKWEDCAEEIEIYLQWLTLNINAGKADGTLNLSPSENIESANLNPDMSTPAKIQALKAQLEEAKKIAEERRMEARSNIERRTRAERVISSCNRRAENLEADLKEEMAHQINLKKELDSVREQIEEVTNDVLECKTKLKSALELQAELKNILHANSSDKLRFEVGMEKAMTERVEILREIDEMRRQRDVLRRRIYFSRKRVPIAPSNGLECCYRQFTVEELREATDNFSKRMRVAPGICRGRIDHSTVAIKLETALTLEEFEAKMRTLSQIRHPNIITLIGACKTVPSKPVVFEYMPNRSLHDHIFRSKRSNGLDLHITWPTRIRIASDVCSALAFLHGTHPTPTPHANLKASNVLLDRAFAAKVADLRVDLHCRSGEDLDNLMRLDVCNLGILMLQLLSGREAVVVEEMERAVGGDGVLTVDERAGPWPQEVALRFARLGVRCALSAHVGDVELGMETVGKEMEEVRRQAELWTGVYEAADVAPADCCYDAPGAFLCPILQEVMKQPYVAADGFSYELDVIKEWLETGHNTSPMTNLKLSNNLLTPNHTLRSLILDWQSSRSRP